MHVLSSKPHDVRSPLSCPVWNSSAYAKRAFVRRNTIQDIYSVGNAVFIDRQVEFPAGRVEG